MPIPLAIIVGSSTTDRIITSQRRNQDSLFHSCSPSLGDLRSTLAIVSFEDMVLPATWSGLKSTIVIAHEQEQKMFALHHYLLVLILWRATQINVNPLSMLRYITPAIVTCIITAFLTGCSPEVEQSPDKNALVIQADFAGEVMVGVAYSVRRDLDIYNVRPLIPLYDIRTASKNLAYNAQTWPAGTVFVSVVDPGVGTDRKSVVLETINGLFFVSPDNGSLSDPAVQYGIRAVREIDESVNRRPETDWSHTFHGRDVYSYTGAKLAAGVISYDQVGPLLEPQVIMLDTLGAKLENGILQGFVVGGTGRLGNISFSIDRHLFDDIEPVYGDIFEIKIRNKNLIAWQGNTPYVKSFGDVPVGDNLLFVNSSGDLSLAINQGNFSHEFGIKSGKDWSIEISRQ